MNIDEAVALEAANDRYVSLAIRYLDPDLEGNMKGNFSHGRELEGLITLLLLLGAVAVCFGIMLEHLRN